MKRLSVTACVHLLALSVGCVSDSIEPGTSGSINLQLVTTDGATAAAGAVATQPLQSIRVTVDGPTPQTATFACAARCEGTIDGLDPGSYSVVVEGLIGNEVDHFGQTSGVTVVAGENSTATINFRSFRPVISAFPVDTTEVLRFTVSYSAVPTATGYRVEYAQAADFSGATAVTLNGTSTEIVVADEAEYFVRVRATNDVVTAGRWSDARSVVALQAVATVTVTPSTPTVAAGATQQFVAEARDADNNVVSNVTFFWASSNHNVATVNQSGLATGVGGGSATITAVGKGMPGGAALTVNPRVPAQLAFTVQPEALGLAGTAMSPALQVEIRDAGGALVTSARDAVTLAIETNPAGDARLIGTQQVNAVNGIATFPGIAISKAGLGYELRASAAGLTDAMSDLFDVTTAVVIYKNADAWQNGEEVALRNAPFYFRSGEDYWVRPMADLQLGVPGRVRVVILPSIISTTAPFVDQLAQQNHADAQAALDAFVQGGGWLAGHLADNIGGGYMIPGLLGVADDVTSCAGLTLATGNHPLVRGPNEAVGGDDDLNNTNIDAGAAGWCQENHGSLAGILPPGATILINEQGDGLRPVYATYAHGQGRVIVTTITIEGPAAYPFLTAPVPTLTNSYYWILRGAGAPTSSASPMVADGSVAGSSTPTGDTWISSTRRR